MSGDLALKRWAGHHPEEVMHRLALAGAQEAVDAARALLEGPTPVEVARQAYKTPG